MADSSLLLKRRQEIIDHINRMAAENKRRQRQSRHTGPKHDYQEPVEEPTPETPVSSTPSQFAAQTQLQRGMQRIDYLKNQMLLRSRIKAIDENQTYYVQDQEHPGQYFVYTGKEYKTLLEGQQGKYR